MSCRVEANLRVQLSRSQGQLYTVARMVAAMEEPRGCNISRLTNAKDRVQSDKIALAQHIQHCSDCKGKR